MHEHADIRAAKLRQTQISRTADMASDQTTTDSYVLVDESVLNAERHNRVRFVVEETGSSNAVDARIVGRIKDADGSWSAWQADPGSNAAVNSLAAGASTLLYVDNVAFDEYGVEIKADTPSSQGDVNVKGKSFFLQT